MKDKEHNMRGNEMDLSNIFWNDLKYVNISM